MSKFKEVWYVCKKQNAQARHQREINKVLSVVRSDGLIIEPQDAGKDIHIPLVAYTLGEKRRRVECEECEGFGVILFTASRMATHCNECNGTGKVWEYSK